MDRDGHGANAPLTREWGREREREREGDRERGVQMGLFHPKSLIPSPGAGPLLEFSISDRSNKALENGTCLCLPLPERLPVLSAWPHLHEPRHTASVKEPVSPHSL